jgi:eukaryotic-like serine/threonine-protein kinase
MTLSPGVRLGPYEIVSPLGAGAMGAVYRSRDSRLGRQVAIKVLPAGSLTDEEARLRFEQEVKAAGALNHPNVLSVFDTGVQEGLPYVVSELLEGETLRKRLAAGLLTIRKALDYAVQIARGLAAAHDKGIVHRDLKPENLFVTRDGQVKILDFGLAKRAQRGEGWQSTGSLTIDHALTEPGIVLGTLGYMSPEQIQGIATDARSDIFAFGLVLYEMLSGHRAFRRETPGETMAAILKDDPQELVRLRPEIPPALERIVSRCLEKRPEERFQSARDIAFAIEALSGLPGGLPKVAAMGGAGARRRRGLALGAALASAFGLVFFVGRSTAPVRVPEFKRLTLHRGPVRFARFGPDGRSVVYSAASRIGPPLIFSTGLESPEPKALGLPPAVVLSISAAGQMALRLSRDADPSSGTLAELSLAATGSPREILDGVQDASWAPDGRRLCVLKAAGGAGQRLEFPIGEVVYRPARNIESPRVAPTGDRIAFTDGDSVQVIDTAGKNLATLTSQPGHVHGLAWSPAGTEVWFTAGDAWNSGLYAVTLGGRQRLVYRLPGDATLEDISPAGQILLTHGFEHFGVGVLPAGETSERELTGFTRPRIAALHPDGKTLLVVDDDERGRGGSVYLRRADGSPSQRLGDGQACDLSPDGQWALVLVPGAPARLSLLSTDSGEPRSLPLGRIEPVWGAFFPDGGRLLVLGREPGQEAQLFVQGLDEPAPVAMTPEGFHLPEAVLDLGPPAAISPDGKLVAAMGPGSKLFILSLEHAEPREVPGLELVVPVRWTADGKGLYVRSRGEAAGRLLRVDPWTGDRELWKDLVPPDPTGVTLVGGIRVTADGRSYAYAYTRQLLDLYLVEGLQ